MIYSLSGTIRTKQPNFVVLEVSGVGFGVKTTLNTTSKLGREGEQGFLYTHLNVREDALELYGFAQQSELECFLMLISISGVGPKAALTILSDRSPEEFALLVASEDVKALSKSSGIGPKTAQRIVLELKDKIGATQAAAQVQEGGEAIPLQNGSKNAAEAVSALVVLGFTQSEAAGVIRKLDAGLPVEEMIRIGLKQLSKL